MAKLDDLKEQVHHILKIRATTSRLGLDDEKNVARQYMAIIFKTDERTIRRAIEALRDEAVTIISTCDRKGYYMGTRAEFNAYNAKQKAKHAGLLEQDLSRERASLRAEQRENGEGLF